MKANPPTRAFTHPPTQPHRLCTRSHTAQQQHAPSSPPISLLPHTHSSTLLLTHNDSSTSTTLPQQQQQHSSHEHTPTRTQRLSLRELRPLIRNSAAAHARRTAAAAPSSTAEAAELRKAPNKLLTKQIMASRSWQEAYALFDEFSDVFNPINTVALITRMSKLVRSRGGHR